MTFVHPKQLSFVWEGIQTPEDSIPWLPSKDGGENVEETEECI